MKKIIILILLIIIPTNIFALDFTSESTDGDKIYIAGNPDMQPLEYYDSTTGEYKGIVTEIYKEIEKQTGLEFVYISKGTNNIQEQLAKNSQAEIISVHKQNMTIDGINEYILMNLDGQSIYIGFSNALDKEKTELIKNCLKEYDSEKLLSLSLKETIVDKTNNNLLLYTIIAIFILIFIVAILFYLNIKFNKKLKKMNRSLYRDNLTDTGNYKYLEDNYKILIKPENYSLFYLAYIGIDTHIIEKYLGGSSLEDIQKKAVKSLNEHIDNEYVIARIKDGVFGLLFQSTNDENAKDYITSILSELNSQDELLKEYKIKYTCGIYALDKYDPDFKNSFDNARLAYETAISKHEEICFATKDMVDTKERNIKLEKCLKKAIENDEFKIYLQYIVDSQEKICGCEILSRWDNKEFGFTKPDIFIKALIDLDLIDDFDFYIFDKTCRLLETYGKGDKKDLWIACNFTRQTFSKQNFEERFNAIIKKYDFDHTKLFIELTEESIISNYEQAKYNMDICKKNGLSISIDDLGMGYSSIFDLYDYPIDMVKIDRFILANLINEKGLIFLNSLISLAHSLNIKVLCEGIETKLQSEVALKATTDYMQGFYYSKVLPIIEAEKHYENYNIQVINKRAE